MARCLIIGENFVEAHYGNKIAESKERLERAHHTAIFFLLFGFDIDSISAAYVSGTNQCQNISLIQRSIIFSNLTGRFAGAVLCTCA